MWRFVAVVALTLLAAQTVVLVLLWRGQVDTAAQLQATRVAVAQVAEAERRRVADERTAADGRVAPSPSPSVAAPDRTSDGNAGRGASPSVVLDDVDLAAELAGVGARVAEELGDRELPRVRAPRVRPVPLRPPTPRDVERARCAVDGLQSLLAGRPATRC